VILLVARVTESLPSRAEWLKRRSFVAAILAFRLNQSAEPLLNAARSSTFVSPAHIDGSGHVYREPHWPPSGTCESLVREASPAPRSYRFPLGYQWQKCATEKKNPGVLSKALAFSQQLNLKPL